MKSKTTAAILALFLGGLGIHKFYLNRGGQGVVYLLLCWTMIPAVIGFFEAIVYLAMDDRAFQQKYGEQQYLPAGGGGQTAQNVTVNMPGGHGQGGNHSVSDELAKLSKLRTAGVLTEDEFRSQKMKLLQ